MTKLVLLTLLLFGMIGCGGGSAQDINGFWTAQAWNSGSQSLAFTFTATLSQAGGNTVNVSTFNFSGPVPCFASTPLATATFTHSGTANGVQTGSFFMNVSTTSSLANITLALTGTRGSNGNITGTWNLTGPTVCSGSGTFLMNIPPPV